MHFLPPIALSSLCPPVASKGLTESSESVVIHTAGLARSNKNYSSLAPESDSGVSSGQSTGTVPWEAECDHQDCDCEQETIVV